MLKILFSKDAVRVIFVLGFAVGVLVSILEAAQSKVGKPSIRKWLNIVKAFGVLLFDLCIVFFGAWTFYTLFHWDSRIMRGSFGDSPEWLQKASAIGLGIMGVVGGVYMSVVKISQIRRGQWSESPNS